MGVARRNPPRHKTRGKSNRGNLKEIAFIFIRPSKMQVGRHETNLSTGRCVDAICSGWAGSTSRGLRLELALSPVSLFPQRPNARSAAFHEMPVSRRARTTRHAARVAKLAKTPRLRPVRNASNGMHFLLAWI